jgi:hypothetical protein
MDFMKALTFPFDDEEWLKKLGLGVLIQFIPIIGGLALQGWSFELSKRVKNNDPVPLPDWSEFGGKMGKGFMIFLAGLIYQIPTLIMGCIIGFAPTLMAAGGDSDEAMAALGTMATVIMVCCGCLILIYAIVAGITFWGGYIRYLDTEQFSTFMQIGENFGLVRSNLGDFGMALLYVIGAGVIASLVSSVTFGLGGLVSTPFLLYFSGHILGQLAQKLAGTAAAPAV